MKNEIINRTKSIFPNNDSLFIGFAPGRINLIGEHLDYNGGFVLPSPLDIGTYGSLSIRTDNKVFCYSENFKDMGICSFSLEQLEYKKEHHWMNYIKGLVKELKIDKGFNLYVEGNIPAGAGLSSSASLEILVSILINEAYQLNKSKLDLVLIAQSVENNYIGVASGIMDQFVIAMTRRTGALLLNTTNLEYKTIDIDLKNYSLIIGNTNKRRTLQDSKYNERRKECEDALCILKQRFSINNLCELSLKELESSKDLLLDNVLYKRARHVVSENERTLQAVRVLGENNYALFGKLLNDSHKSLCEDYQVTGIELDTLVNLFQKHGAIGARMTGAGFGGCMITLVEKRLTDDILEKVRKYYKKALNLNPEFYLVNISKGALLL